MLIILIFFIVMAIFMYLLILGADRCKSIEEQIQEDEEESRYFNNKEDN